jgi:hypothetical protein
MNITKDTTVETAQLLKKFESIKKESNIDLSSGEDLSLAIANLVSIEEHLFFTGSKLERPVYFDLLNDIRSMRVRLMKQLVANPEGEEWCISKHLLSSSYRLMEVGTKNLSLGKKKEAQNMFTDSFGLYSMFWGIVMKQGKETSKNDELNKGVKTEIASVETEQKGVLSRFGDFVKKAVDCCIE